MEETKLLKKEPEALAVYTKAIDFANEILEKKPDKDKALRMYVRAMSELELARSELSALKSEGSLNREEWKFLRDRLLEQSDRIQEAVQALKNPAQNAETAEDAVQKETKEK